MRDRSIARMLLVVARTGDAEDMAALRVLIDEHEEALDALDIMTPMPGFPKCDRRCASNGGHPEEEARCDCGFEEIRDTAEKCRAVLSRAGRR